MSFTDFKQTTSYATIPNFAKKVYNSTGKYKTEKSKHIKMVKTSLHLMENALQAMVKFLNLL